MKVAYVDTSCLVAVALGERGAAAVERRLARFDRLVSSNLLEAELRAALRREGVEGASRVLSSITWLLPDRPLSAEIAAVLEAGYVRGADCWHLATALYLAPEPSELSFMTLDERQRDVAALLGFGA
ncbi:MAG: PIN domain-containing protein [Gemmatimonadetes bacterium]|nr:PIN domain-containing protein [Gemmatimonadota bacterium]